MRLIPGLFITVLMAVLVVGCSNSDNGSGRATLVIQFAPPTAKHSARAVDANQTQLPVELTRVVFEVKNDKDELVSEGDWLASNGKLELIVPAGVKHTLTGTAYAGAEILFGGTATVSPLNAGERRQTAIALASKVTIQVSPSTLPGVITPQSIIRVSVGETDPIRFTSNVTGLTDTRIRWFVNQIEGGDATVGRVDTQGNYTPPLQLPENTVVTVQAVPVVAPSFDASLPIQLLPNTPIPQDTQPPISQSAPLAGDFITQVSVVLSCDDCTEIFFTTDGSEPTFSSQPYSQPLLLTADTVLKFFALDAAGNREIAVHSQTYHVETLPAAPSAVFASAGNAQASLSWGAVSNARSYNVYRALTPALSSSDQPFKTGLTEPGFMDSDVTNETTYFYAVIAVNRAGTSALSTIHSAKPTSGRPLAPSQLIPQAGDGQVSLKWQASQQGVTYTLFRNTVAGIGTNNPSLVFGLEGTSFNDATAKNDITYYYTVTANNSVGASAASNEVSAKPMPPLPAVPSDLSALSGDRQITLNWTAVPKADSYNIHRSTDGVASNFGDPFSNVTAVTQFIDTGLLNGTTYYYVVSAVNISGSSKASAIVHAKPSLTPCVWGVSLWGACNWQ